MFVVEKELILIDEVEGIVEQHNLIEIMETYFELGYHLEVKTKLRASETYGRKFYKVFYNLKVFKEIVKEEM